MVPVLISTYWNVNAYRGSQYEANSSFNLNLLECKYDLCTFVNERTNGFNLNLLECK